MEWQDDGIILDVRLSGEHAALVAVFTPGQGKWLGRIAGGQSAKKRSWLTPGTGVAAHWGARLEEQLGNWRLEPAENRSAHAFDDPLRLSALGYLCALTEATAQERLPLPILFNGLQRALDEVLQRPLDTGGPRRTVIDYERLLLDQLGYGLDLSSCAATGARDELAFLSPNTGRAVSRTAALPYKDRMLPLPPYWLTKAAPTPDELRDGARTTGFFLARHFFPPPGDLPASRMRVCG